MITTRAKSFIASKIRLAWRYYSEERKDCLTATVCSSCKCRGQELFADHIDPVGTFTPEDNPYIMRMFCQRSNLQALCKACHDPKSAKERTERAAIRKAKKLKGIK